MTASVAALFLEWMYIYDVAEIPVRSNGLGSSRMEERKESIMQMRGRHSEAIIQILSLICPG